MTPSKHSSAVRYANQKEDISSRIPHIHPCRDSETRYLQDKLYAKASNYMWIFLVHMLVVYRVNYSGNNPKPKPKPMPRIRPVRPGSARPSKWHSAIINGKHFYLPQRTSCHTSYLTTTNAERMLKFAIPSDVRHATRLHSSNDFTTFHDYFRYRVLFLLIPSYCFLRPCSLTHYRGLLRNFAQKYQPFASFCCHADVQFEGVSPFSDFVYFERLGGGFAGVWLSVLPQQDIHTARYILDWRRSPMCQIKTPSQGGEVVASLRPTSWTHIFAASSPDNHLQSMTRSIFRSISEI